MDMEKQSIPMNDLLSKIYTSNLRSVLRRTGFMKIFGCMNQFRNLIKYMQYEISNPNILKMKINNIKANFLVSDKQEFSRVSYLQHDKHIIKCLIDNIRLGDCVWDIGASIGLYSVLLGKALGNKGKVFSFEPENKSFKRLVQNIQENKIENVNPYNIALGNKNDKVKLKIEKHFTSGAHTCVGLSGGQDNNIDNYEEIEIYNGDSFRVLNKIEIPSIIKIDVEGAEEDVLVGLSETLDDVRCRLIVSEIHFSVLESTGRKDTPANIQRLLLAKGFRKQKWLDPSHLAAFKDNH